MLQCHIISLNFCKQEGGGGSDITASVKVTVRLLGLFVDIICLETIKSNFSFTVHTWDVFYVKS